MLEHLKARLVADWRTIMKWWSVRWAALGAVLLPTLQVIPATLPPDLQALLPPSVRAIITGLWCLGFIVLRAWAQQRPNA